MLQELTPGQFVVSALAVAALFVAKMSGPLILPMMAVLVLVRLWQAQPLEVRFGRAWIVASRLRQLLVLFAATATIGAVVVLGIWATYGVRYAALAADDAYRPKLA